MISAPRSTSPVVKYSVFKLLTFLHFRLRLQPLRVVRGGEGVYQLVQVSIHNGIDFIQGYYFYKPMPQSDFYQLIDGQ